MHARAVIALDRLRHEGRGLAIGMGHVLHDILVLLHGIGAVDQRAELHAQFMLGRGHFVVMLFHFDAHGGEGGQHFGAEVAG